MILQHRGISVIIININVIDFDKLYLSSDIIRLATGEMFRDP